MLYRMKRNDNENLHEEYPELRQMTYKAPITKRDSLDIYDDVKETNSYVCVVDVARGRGLDYSAVSVFDTSTFPIIQVAKYR